MNPWVILIVIVTWLASLAGVGYWQNEAGQTQVRTEWLKKDNTKLVEANAKIATLTEKARADEHRYAQNQADISKILEKERQDAKRKTDQLIADYHAGTLRLRDPGNDRQKTGRSTSGQTASAAGRCYGDTTAELSNAAGEFLLNLTGEADEVVNQLTACQKNLLSDRSAQ